MRVGGRDFVRDRRQRRAHHLVPAPLHYRPSPVGRTIVYQHQLITVVGGTTASQGQPAMKLVDYRSFIVARDDNRQRQPVLPDRDHPMSPAFRLQWRVHGWLRPLRQIRRGLVFTDIRDMRAKLCSACRGRRHQGEGATPPPSGTIHLRKSGRAL
jgi:hypothetical protein